MRTPDTSTGLLNGSTPLLVPSAIQTTMIPIDSYHDAFFESYVVVIESTSPLWTTGRQVDGVAVIATSHDTSPAGSK